MKLIGLTGGIGSGKSSVARAFASNGALILDADQLAKQARAPGTAGHAAILARFQTDDRLELRKILSESIGAKQDLELILHPLIKEASDLEIKRLALEHPQALCLIYEASLLLEAGRAADFEKIIIVTSPLSARIKRIIERDCVTREQALLMIQAQHTDDFRLPFADFIIENDGDLSHLDSKARKVLDQIISA